MRTTFSMKLLLASMMALGAAAMNLRAADDKPTPIAIAEIKHEGPVNFEKEVLPLLRKNCVACHNATKKENSLVLENPKTIVAGGDSGPAAVAGKSAESLLLLAAAHQGDTVMPPADNTVGAKNLTPEELGLIKRWIDEGATGEVTGSAGGPVNWQPLPAGINPIYAVSVTADGQLVACGRANQIFVYHLPSGRLITRLTDAVLLSSGLYKQAGVAHYDLVQSLAFSPDGELLASGSYREVKLWKRPHPTPSARVADQGSPIKVVAANPDGTLAALGLESGAIQLWDVAGARPGKKLEGHRGAVTSLRFFAEGKKLLSGSADKSLRIWDPAQGAETGRIDTPAPVTAVTALADGSRLASGGADNLVRTWAAPIGTDKSLDIAAPTAIAASANRKTVAVAGADGTIAVIESIDGTVGKKLEGRKVAVVAMSITPDGGRIAAAEADGAVRVWDVAQNKVLVTVATGQPALTSVAMHPSGNQLITGSADGRAATWKLDLAAGTSMAADPLATPAGKKIVDILFRPDGNLIYLGVDDGTILGFQPAGPQAFAVNHGAKLNDLAISNDAKLLASAGDDKQVKVWNADNGGPAQKPQLAGFTAPVAAVGFSSDSQKVIGSAAAPGEVLVFGVTSGALEQAQTGLAVPATLLASLGEQANIVITAGANGPPKLWSTVAQQTLAGHGQPISAVEAVPGIADQLLSASLDGSIRRWNLQNGQQQQQVDHGGAISAMVVRGDGQQVASAGASGLVKLWKGDLNAWQAPNNQPIPEMKGDLRAQLRLAQAERSVATLTVRIVEQKKGVTDAEAKVTMTAEAVKTAMTAKDTAAKNAVDKVAAAKAPVEAKAAADKEVEAAIAALKEATDKAEAAKVAAEKEPQNQELAKARDEAKKVAEQADQKKKEAEKKSKDLAEPANKATQEAATAEAGAMAAEQALTAAMNAAQKATETVPLAKATLDASEKAFAAAQAEAAAAKTAVADGEKPIKALSYSADGSQLASAGDNQVIRTWSAESGQPIETYAAHQSPVQSVAFAGDGAVVSVDAKAEGIVWQSEPAWQLVRTIGNVDDPSTFIDRVLALSFSPDGKLLATGGGEPSRSGEFKIFNVADGKLDRAIADAHSDTIFGVSFSPDGKQLASCAADRFVKVFDATKGTLLRSFEGHTHHVLGVAWRADGKVIASCGADNVVKVWDSLTGDQKLTTQPLGKEVTSIQFIGDSPRAMVTSGDKTVRLFNTDNGGNERNYPGGEDFMYSLANTIDGKIAVGGGQDSVLKVWNVENTQVIRTFDPPKPKSPEPNQSADKK